MTKPALRYLSLGFLISAVILLSFSFFNKEEASSNVDSSTQEEQVYKEKYESLAAKTESKKSESGKTIEEKGNTANSKLLIKSTIIIRQGDPSDNATQQLKNAGIIKNSAEFNDYLEKNNYAKNLRPGSHVVTSEMDFEDLAYTLMQEN
ncbi:MAG: hypothetical protein L0K82_07925 [Pisciglobus halotolerans]|nr:hypothetical protein [Pisciglobus halotolerans]